MTAATRPPKLLRTGRRREIKDSITGWMREQGLAPGDRIPGQNELAAIFSTTPLTIHRALSELSDEGVVRRESRRGTFAGPALAASHTRQICLVLPADHLDEPAHNPIYWPYTQKLYRSFLDAVGADWIFSSRVVAPGTPPRTARAGVRRL